MCKWSFSFIYYLIAYVISLYQVKYWLINVVSAVHVHLPSYYILLNKMDLDSRRDKVSESASGYLISMFYSCSALKR